MDGVRSGRGPWGLLPAVGGRGAFPPPAPPGRPARVRPWPWPRPVCLRWPGALGPPPYPLLAARSPGARFGPARALIGTAGAGGLWAARRAEAAPGCLSPDAAASVGKATKPRWKVTLFWVTHHPFGKTGRQSLMATQGIPKRLQATPQLTKSMESTENPRCASLRSACLGIYAVRPLRFSIVTPRAFSAS